MRSKLTLGVVVVALLAAIAVTAVRRSAPTRPTVESDRVARQAVFRSTITASGEVVATQYADIGSDVMGKIVSLPVAEGDRVNRGQLLARVDPVPAESDALAAAALVSALEADERAASEQVRVSTGEVDAAIARQRDADQVFSRKRDLSVQGLIPATEFDTAKAGADQARAALVSARAAVQRARESLLAAGRRVAQARAQQVRANDVFKKTSILSPIDGIVSRLRVRAGEMVVVGLQNQPGTTLMTISDLTSVNAEVKVAEADVLRVAVGQPAQVVLEAMPGKRFSGKVIEVGASALPLAGSNAAAREFRVVVRLDQPDPGLRPGLTCDAEVITSERRDVLTVPLQSVVLRREPDGGAETTGVFALDGAVARFRAVTQGPIGGLDVEVAGLAEGTRVVVGPFQVLRELKDGTAVIAAAPKKPN